MPKDLARATRRGPVDRALAEGIAIAALGFIASDPTRLAAFLDATGLAPQTLRQAASDPDFLSGLLDFLAGADDLLVAFAAEVGETPERVMAARQALSPADEP